jgi:hypothetical protein
MRSNPKPGCANLDSRRDPNGTEDDSGSADAALSGSAMSGMLMYVYTSISNEQKSKDLTNKYKI